MAAEEPAESGRRYGCYESFRLNEGCVCAVAGQVVAEGEDDDEDGGVAAEECVARWERGVRKERPTTKGQLRNEPVVASLGSTRWPKRHSWIRWQRLRHRVAAEEVAEVKNP